MKTELEIVKDLMSKYNLTTKDLFSNPIAIVEEVNGETHLVLVDNALQRYGVTITHEDITPKEW